MKIHATSIAVLALTAVTAAGCGDDDETTTGAATGPLTKPEFVQQADQICTQGDAQIEQAGGETFAEGKPTPEEEEQFLTETVIPNIQGQIDDIRALTPPEGDEKDVAAILDAAQEGIDEAESHPSALSEREGSGSDPFAEATKLAREYGLEACGQG